MGNEELLSEGISGMIVHGQLIKERCRLHTLNNRYELEKQFPRVAHGSIYFSVEAESGTGLDLVRDFLEPHSRGIVVGCAPAAIMRGDKGGKIRDATLHD